MAAPVRYECKFVNAAGERRRVVVTVKLTADEHLRCKLNPQTEGMILRSIVAQRAAQQVPPGFTALDLDLAGVQPISLKLVQ